MRGDRLPTGGAPRARLTEDELSARMAAAALHNAKRAEAHARAEEDAASFRARETRAAARRAADGTARRALDGERERNRLRKLGARRGREWDEGKEEAERGGGRGGGYRRGAHGAVEGGFGGGRGEGAVEEDAGFGEGGGRGRGRGGRGLRGRGRGGRGRGRADYVAGVTRDGLGGKDASELTRDDFPALEKNNTPTAAPSQEAAQDVKSPVAEKGSWADQVEAGQAGGA